MTQMNLFELALPEIWTVGNTPKEDGLHKCRVKKHNGEISVMELESKNNKFIFDGGAILAFR